MRGIDTNVVVRFLTNDDKRQAKAARAAIEGGDIFVATTVLLESEWVLRSGYGFTPERIINGLRSLAGISGVTIEEPIRVAQALDWMAGGMDFADALHLAGSDGCDQFRELRSKVGQGCETKISDSGVGALSRECLKHRGHQVAHPISVLAKSSPTKSRGQPCSLATS